MDVDNTPTRTYIYDLDAELAAAEPELGVDGASCPDHHQQQQQQLVFIPDIEKHLNKLPEQLLRGRLLSSTLGGGDDAVSSNSQLVLYSEPTSLSVPPERDSVRKAVVEARQRMRERQAIGGYVAPTPLLTAPEQSTHAHKTDRGLDAAAGQTWQWPGWPHFDSIAYTPAESRIVDEMDVS